MAKRRRNYKQEAKYEARPEQKKRRAARNRARRKLIRLGRVRKGDGKEVDHKKMLGSGGSMGMKNIRVISRHANRVKQPKHKKRYRY